MTRRDIRQVTRNNVEIDSTLRENMSSDSVIAKHNQAELSKLEARTTNSVYSLMRLAELPGQLGLKCKSKIWQYST